MKKLVVLFSGMGTNLAYILEHLHQKNGFEVVMVLTNNPNAKGIEIAKRYNIKIEIISNKDFDNRVEFSYHDLFSNDLKVDIFFAYPYYF